MGKTKWTYWSNENKKPKRFSFVNGSSMTYTYEVPIFNYSKFIENISINVKMKRSSYTTGVDIDDSFVNDYIKKEIGVLYRWERGLFRRDGTMFPFVMSIEINDADEYLQFKKLKQRKLKLEQIKSKINV